MVAWLQGYTVDIPNAYALFFWLYSFFDITIGGKPAGRIVFELVRFTTCRHWRFLQQEEGDTCSRTTRWIS